MRTGENIRQRADGRFEARYKKGRDEEGKIIYGYSYGKTYEEAKTKREKDKELYISPTQLNLLIVGAGSHGLDIAELVKSFRMFNKVRFLDDNVEAADVIGKCAHFEWYQKEFPVAIAAVGDRGKRKAWFEDLVADGYIVPTLVHPTAVIGADAKIGLGSVICAGATIGSKCKIGKGCIIDSGAIVERGAVVPDWTLVPCGAIYNNEDKIILNESEYTEQKI